MLFLIHLLRPCLDGRSGHSMSMDEIVAYSVNIDDEPVLFAFALIGTVEDVVKIAIAHRLVAEVTDLFIRLKPAFHISCN